MGDGARNTFPPYPENVPPVPPSVADAVVAGNEVRAKHKALCKKTVLPAPKPAKPRGPKVTDEKLSKRAMRAHARCLRKHGAVLTDRLELMSKPRKRTILYLLRERADALPADFVARLRNMLDADEPFKPDQAYEYFVNLRKAKKFKAAQRCKDIKKDVMALYNDKRFEWARNATVAFAKGVQQRLARPGHYALADGAPKAKFMMEMSDKIAVWIDGILTQSDERMLMMDFDEDEDVLALDQFLNMMAGGGLFGGPLPAYMMFTGEMLEAFLILTDSMTKKGDVNLVTLGKFSQSYEEGAEELKTTKSFDATEFSTEVASKLNSDLASCAKSTTPKNIEPYMKDMVEICANYLAQNAEYSKDKGPAFRLLVKQMRTKGTAKLYQKDKVKRNYDQAATELEEAKGLETDHDDPALTQQIHADLSKLVEGVTPDNLKTDMKETLDLTSKYLSQRAIDELERGPAFDLLIKELEAKGGEPFLEESPPLSTKFAAAYVLKSAPGLTSITPDTATAPMFNKLLHLSVDTVTPSKLVEDMKGVIDRCANYLSAFLRDRDKAMQALIAMMKSNASKELAKRKSYGMDYGTGAMEVETSPAVIPYLPIKDIADEGKEKLTKDMESLTPPELKIAMKCAIQDVSKYLSQAVALRSGVAGDRYPLNLLAAIMNSLGNRQLFRYKVYGQTYADGGQTLKYSGVLESDPKAKDLQQQILTEMSRGIPMRIAPTIAKDMIDIMTAASEHLAKIGMEKGAALMELVARMKEKGDVPLAVMQGYEQSYKDGARRIENALTLTTNNVDKAVYNNVLAKLTTLMEQNPSKEHEKYMPGIIDEASKFLASPMPETSAEKRRVLADLMARKGDEIFGQEKCYKLTYTEAGEEMLPAPVGVTTALDPNYKQELLDKMVVCIPEKKLADKLKDAANECSAYLSDIIKGRGEAMQTLHDSLQKEGGKEFISIGDFNKTYAQTADMLATAPKFGGHNPSPVIYDKVNDRMVKLDLSAASELGKQHMPDAKKIATKYIAGVGTLECGLDASALAALDDRGLNNMGGRGAGGDEDDDEERRRREAELRRLRAAAGRPDYENDPEFQAALKILLDQLRLKGKETMYKQAQTDMTHALAAQWIEMRPRMEVDQYIKESSETEQLQKNFEKKLGLLVAHVTPPELENSMQDVIIDCAVILARYFVQTSSKALARDALISAMQSRGNEKLVEIDGRTESSFYAAQRLKKTQNLEVAKPNEVVAHEINEKLNETIKTISIPRKIGPTLKSHIRDASNYLSVYVTQPNEDITAYVAMLEQMELTGNTLLFEGEIPKSFKFCAAYLRKLTSYEDLIKRPNAQLQATIERKIDEIMTNVTPEGYSKPALKGQINNSAILLVSYMMLLIEKTEALKFIVEKMDDTGKAVLLRHGVARKSFTDGADELRGKTADQLAVTCADSVVCRKLEIKLNNLMVPCTPAKFKDVMEELLEEVTRYLAVQLLKSRVTQVCKCMKDESVQCAMSCEAMSARVTRPCCTCSRPVTAAVFEGLSPEPRVMAASSHVDVSVRPCASRATQTNCPVHNDTTASGSCGPTKQDKDEHQTYYVHVTHNIFDTDRSPTISLKEPSFISEPELPKTTSLEEIDSSYRSPEETQESSTEDDDDGPYYQYPTTMYASVHTKHDFPTRLPERRTTPECSPTRTSPPPCRFSSTRVPVISTDEMSDWHAMMVSLMWNVQAWQDWIQENIDLAMFNRNDERDETWGCFCRRVTTDAIQWRQYNRFSRQLTLRLAQRYKDKKIVSPTRATDRTDAYIECQREMLDIVDKFSNWTQWLSVIAKECDSQELDLDSGIPKQEQIWANFKTKVEEYYEDWLKYNRHLKVCWEHRYRTLIAEWVPQWNEPGPVWVVSACGTVPSGAVAAGVHRDELVWVARTTHKNNVLPGALHPSKHCCIVYADGAVHHYTKYQVLCNSSVRWRACRAGGGAGASAGAVRAAAGVLVGRVHHRGQHLVGAVLAPHYRCHVVIFGRPFAFTCYELLVLAEDQED